MFKLKTEENFLTCYTVIIQVLINLDLSSKKEIYFCVTVEMNTIDISWRNP